MKELSNSTRDIARELARKYSTMTHDELDILESVLVPMRFAKGEMILKEGETCQHIYYIERGLVRQFYFKNGKQLTEHIGVEGSIFMCIESLFQEKPSLLQVEALEPTLIYALPKRRLEEVALHNVNIQILFRNSTRQIPQLVQTHAASGAASTAALCGQLLANDARNPVACSGCILIFRSKIKSTINVFNSYKRVFSMR